MSLSEEIHQKEFRSEYQKAMINIMYTHNFIVNQMTDVFKDFDITRQQYNVLRILRGQYPEYATINLIKERLLDKMSDTSRLVERLRLKELISREDCQTDKRSVEIKITPKGMALLEKMDKPIKDFEQLLQTLTQEEARHLNHLLDKLRGGIHLHALGEQENEALELMK